MSFWGIQKDKRELESGQIVLLEVSKRQKKAGPGANCPFWGFKKTKESRTRGKLSFWGLQKDKRELESEQIVHLEVSKRQKRTHAQRVGLPRGQERKIKSKPPLFKRLPGWTAF
ncbi:hypothetical protein B4098_3422 [Heyndrickxia coagulans]|uniref:Uncharacterized protein n=1 Tax=Heyndrickxia coagulans TaxID=1398 RepID=A0A150K2M0_HEYCO|nr:hypothetical protein B4098_3422 [Heyndrickxia coagulans]